MASNDTVFALFRSCYILTSQMTCYILTSQMTYKNNSFYIKKY